MDKKSILAMLLIAVILILTPYYNENILGIKPEEKKVSADSTTNIQKETFNSVDQQNGAEINKEKQKESVEKINSPKEQKKTNEKVPFTGDSTLKNYRIDTDLYSVKFSNKGGGNFSTFILKKYGTYDSSLVDLVSEKLNNNLQLSFQDVNGQYINTGDYLFTSDNKSESIVLKNNDKITIKFLIEYNKTKIEKELTFYNGFYHIDVSVNISDPGSLLLNRQYQIKWENGLPLTEEYKEGDSQYSTAFTYMADDLTDYSITEAGPAKPMTLSGNADWVSVRTKYFVSILSVVNADVSDGVFFNGTGIEKKDYIEKLYTAGFFVRDDHQTIDKFRLYLGPLDFNQLSNYDNHVDELIMNNGWYERVFRSISIYLIIPVLEWLHGFISNYGLVIIIFSILVKLALFPITKKSYQSTKKMQLLQPKMAEIKEKYKNDQQRMQKEMMKLYKVHGNPLSGCLPMLLQMPLLIALYTVFRSTIQLRGAMFIPGLVNDLSRADTLFTLPFSLPFYGDHFNLLPIIMAITMFFQSKMTMQDPKQKAMLYIMPVFMLAIFNKFPSGLNLYYIMFNILTVLQQKYIHVDKDPKVPQKNK